MKHTLNKDSWHFWLADHFGGLTKSKVDICTYIRKVIRGAVYVTAMSLTAIFFISLYFYGGYEFIVWAIDSNAPAEPPASTILFASINIVVIIGTLALSLAVGAGLFLEWKRERAYNASFEDKPPSFLALAYRKFKEKTCFLVEFK